ncbi:MAG: hypothetical protein ABIG39_03150 [Candidatus Micrarchaeota archaeon]
MASAGIFYSLMVLSLLGPIVLYIISYMDSVKTQGEQMTVKFEGIELANYADSISLDVPRVLDIASKRAIVAVIDHADTAGYGVGDAELELTALVLNNTYSDGSSASIMLNSSFSHWINSTQMIGANHGFIANITVENLSIKHSDPFILNFSIDLHVDITDRTQSMRLNRTYSAFTLISIEGFTDPLYPINTRGLIERVITKVNMTINDTTSTEYMINNSWYVNNPDAPSFLERLQGCTWPNDTAHNCSDEYYGNGIESFIFFPELRAHFEETDPILLPNASMVDHMYFNDTVLALPLYPFPYIVGCNVSGITDGVYDWFKMDAAHNDTYGVGINCS